MAENCNYSEIIKSCGCPKIIIKHINISPGTKKHLIKNYRYICNTELPLSSGIVDLSCLEPNVSAIVVVKKDDKMVIYDFLLTEKPMPSLKYKFLTHDGSCNIMKKIQTLPANTEVNFIIVGAGGNGTPGANGNNGTISMPISSTNGIGIAGKGGAGGNGGAGGSAGEVVMFNITTSENNTFSYSIGFNYENIQNSRDTIISIEKNNEIFKFKASGGSDGVNPGFPGGRGGSGESAIVSPREIIRNAEIGSPGGGDYGGKGGALSSISTMDLLGGGGGGGGGGGKGESIALLPHNVIGMVLQFIGTLLQQPIAGKGGTGGPSESPSSKNGADGAPGINGSFGSGGNGGQGGGGGGGAERDSSRIPIEGGNGGKGNIGGLGGNGFILYYYIDPDI